MKIPHRQFFLIAFGFLMMELVSIWKIQAATPSPGTPAEGRGEGLPPSWPPVVSLARHIDIHIPDATMPETWQQYQVAIVRAHMAPPAEPGADPMVTLAVVERFDPQDVPASWTVPSSAVCLEGDAKVREDEPLLIWV
jgi:hypothetical protein